MYIQQGGALTPVQWGHHDRSQSNRIVRGSGATELEERLTGIEPEKIHRRKPAQESDEEGDVGLRKRMEANEFFFADRYCEIVQ